MGLAGNWHGVGWGLAWGWQEAGMLAKGWHGVGGSWHGVGGGLAWGWRVAWG